jgi:hypothetical protein
MKPRKEKQKRTYRIRARAFVHVCVRAYVPVARACRVGLGRARNDEQVVTRSAHDKGGGREDGRVWVGVHRRHRAEGA